MQPPNADEGGGKASLKHYGHDFDWYRIHEALDHQVGTMPRYIGMNPSDIVCSAWKVLFVLAYFSA